MLNSLPAGKKYLRIQNLPSECHTSVTKSHEFASHSPAFLTECCHLLKLVNSCKYASHFTSIGQMVNGTSEFNIEESF